MVKFRSFKLAKVFDFIETELTPIVLKHMKRGILLMF